MATIDFFMFFFWLHILALMVSLFMLVLPFGAPVFFFFSPDGVFFDVCGCAANLSDKLLLGHHVNAHRKLMHR